MNSIWYPLITHTSFVISLHDALALQLIYLFVVPVGIHPALLDNFPVYSLKHFLLGCDIQKYFLLVLSVCLVVPSFWAV